MPKELEDIAEDMNDMDTVMDEADGAVSAELSADAVSSTAEDVSNTVSDDDTLTVVREVVDQSQAEAEAAASSATSEEDGNEGSEGEPEDGTDDEAFSDVPFNKHPRFQELLQQRNNFKVDAERYRNVQNYIDEQGLEANEAADLLHIGGLIKTNPAEAWRVMRPTVEKLLVAAGEVLPDDLRGMVETGEMTRQAALQVSRSRAEVQSYEVRKQFDVQRSQTAQQQQAVNAVQTAVSTWETSRRQRDPNFDAKMPAIQREIAWLQATDGRPNTPEGVQAQLNKAYEAVSATAVAPTKQRPAIKPVNGGQANGNVRPAPRNTMEIIQAELTKREAASR